MTSADIVLGSDIISVGTSPCASDRVSGDGGTLTRHIVSVDCPSSCPAIVSATNADIVLVSDIVSIGTLLQFGSDIVFVGPSLRTSDSVSGEGDPLLSRRSDIVSVDVTSSCPAIVSVTSANIDSVLDIVSIGTTSRPSDSVSGEGGTLSRRSDIVSVNDSSSGLTVVSVTSADIVSGSDIVSVGTSSCASNSVSEDDGTSSKSSCYCFRR